MLVKEGAVKEGFHACSGELVLQVEDVLVEGGVEGGDE